MNKNERLQLIRQRAATRPALSAQAGEILEQLRTEDPEIGGIAANGETAPDDVRETKRDESDADESVENLEIVSPWMRGVEREADRETRNHEREAVAL